MYFGRGLYYSISIAQTIEFEEIGVYHDFDPHLLVYNNEPIIFEPLTGVVETSLKREILDWLCVGDLPLPDRSNIAQRFNLRETVRQFKGRKTLLPAVPEEGT